MGTYFRSLEPVAALHDLSLEQVQGAQQELVRLTGEMLSQLQIAHQDAVMRERAPVDARLAADVLGKDANGDDIKRPVQQVALTTVDQDRPEGEVETFVVTPQGVFTEAEHNEERHGPVQRTFTSDVAKVNPAKDTTAPETDVFGQEINEDTRKAGEVDEADKGPFVITPAGAEPEGEEPDKPGPVNDVRDSLNEPEPADEDKPKRHKK